MKRAEKAVGAATRRREELGRDRERLVSELARIDDAVEHRAVRTRSRRSPARRGCRDGR